MFLKSSISIKQNYQMVFGSTVRSYSQVFFSDSLLFGFILFLVSFFDLWAGVAGIISIVTSNLLATYLGYSKYNIEKGIYGYNSLLVGLGIGLGFAPGIELLIIVIVAAVFTFFITILVEGVFAKYYLPILSIPFLIGIWTIVLASRNLNTLGLSERGIYTANELYTVGGENMVNIYHWLSNLAIPEFISTYLLSLGAIFFQYRLLAGLLIAIGLFIYSRLSFLLSILGFSMAYWFYQFIGADITYYGYTYIGFNYILTAIALGGHFLVPSRYTFFWVILLLPIVVLLSLSLSTLFAPYQLSIYALPFNIVVLLFLYSLKLRLFPKPQLSEAILQLNNPEKNLYFHQQALKRFQWLSYYPVSLPVHGQWFVSQAHDDTITHKGEWGKAWDFIILDNDGKQFQNEGNLPEDYYCYKKVVIAPAYGVVVEIVDGIEDNTIGEVNLIHNWGNSVVIKHSDYVYSQISHLKSGSFKIKKGQTVSKGDKIALCGNSGRSPYPHVHFQVQASPFVGSKTIDYPIDHYVVKQKDGFKLLSYCKPEKDEIVSNISVDPLLKNAFNFTPGQELNFTEVQDGGTKKELLWEVKTDSYNNSFIHCSASNSYAYFFNDGSLLLFKNFVGDRKSALYHFYLAAYNVPFGFYKALQIEDSFPVNLIFKKGILFLQDFIAPFYLFLKSEYLLEFVSIDNELAPERIDLRSCVESKIFNKMFKRNEFQIVVDRIGVKEIHFSEHYILKRTLT
ncbi:MAG: urea transporter [Bacteroidales bacterium]|nr:urea transporter [Bacteroidales bacterium]